MAKPLKIFNDVMSLGLSLCGEVERESALRNLKTQFSGSIHLPRELRVPTCNRPAPDLG